MTRATFKHLLIEDVQNKKLFDNKWQCQCDGCGGDIVEDQKFIFMGDRNKVCETCIDGLKMYLEENL